MTNIKELTAKLKAAAQKATQGPWVETCGEVTTADYEIEGVTFLDHICNCEIIGTESPNAEFIAAANPANVLALVAALEAAEKRIVELDLNQKLANDAMHAAIALNSAGVNVISYDESVLRLHEWGALPDYAIALYVDFIYDKISENKLLDFGYISDNGAFSASQAERRIAELESKLAQIESWSASAQNYIAELEARTLAVKLPIAATDSGSGYKLKATWAIQEACEDAGIDLKFEE